MNGENETKTVDDILETIKRDLIYKYPNVMTKSSLLFEWKYRYPKKLN
jgi:hypothetical protein